MERTPHTSKEWAEFCSRSAYLQRNNSWRDSWQIKTPNVCRLSWSLSVKTSASKQASLLVDVHSYLYRSQSCATSPRLTTDNFLTHDPRTTSLYLTLIVEHTALFTRQIQIERNSRHLWYPERYIAYGVWNAYAPYLSMCKLCESPVAVPKPPTRRSSKKEIKCIFRLYYSAFLLPSASPGVKSVIIAYDAPLRTRGVTKHHCHPPFRLSSGKKLPLTPGFSVPNSFL